MIKDLADVQLEFEYPPIEEQRRALRTATLDASEKYRIVFVGNFFQGATGIVSSLERALENLGHTVFVIDTARHKSALDKSSGAKGGYGPIFFRPEPLGEVFRTFRPDMLVLCAGGMVLDETARAYLRERGVVTIGLTLSDPDVQSSVEPYVKNFDVHTTNATLSLERYHASGHRNTVLFPFGIDRDYVLRDVPHDASLAADAICIGHAAGREDRHQVMLALAEEHSVRTYGNGWPIPGSEPVAGDRLLQAARAGSVHVNFAATRAGFTNVKCGVFESVGAGALLATWEFPEMAALFEYGTEIIGWESAEDLSRALRELKADPFRAESMRRRAFYRLVHEHLYEHRWIQLFAEVKVRLETGVVEHPSARYVLERATARTRPRVVLLSGFYGAKNLGDDLLLDALAGGIEKRVPDALVAVASVAPAEVERAAGRPAFARAQQATCESWAASASAVLLGPGGLWHDYTIRKANGVSGIVTGATVSPSHLLQLPLMSRAYGGSFHVVGLGVGPLEDPAARASVKLSGDLAASVSVRDEGSRELLKSVEGWRPEVEIVPDLAYSLDLASALSAGESAEGVGQGSGGPYLIVNLRPWEGVDGAIQSLSEVLRDASARYGMRLVGLAMQPTDLQVLQSLQAAIGTDVDFSILPVESSLQDVLACVKEARAVVSMRLHLSLLAHRLGTPAVGIAYDPKVASHFSEIGRGEFALAMPLAENDLRDQVNTVVVAKTLPEEVRLRVREREVMINEYLDRLATTLRAEPVRSRPAGLTEHTPSPRAMRTHAPLAWPASETVDLRRFAVSGMNSSTLADVQVTQRLGAAGLTFGLADRAPERDDSAEAVVLADVQPGEGFRAELLVASRYKENRALSGRLRYEVLVDGVVQLSWDVTSWRGRSSIWVGGTAGDRGVTISVRVRATRKCEAWGWGKATQLTIEGVRVQPWDYQGPTLAGSSNPFASTERVTQLDGSAQNFTGNRREKPGGQSAAAVAGALSDDSDKGRQQMVADAYGRTADLLAASRERVAESEARAALLQRQLENLRRSPLGRVQVGYWRWRRR